MSAKKIFAVFLIMLVVAPAPLLVAPQKAYAIFGIGDIVIDPTNLVQTTLTAIASVLHEIHGYAMWVKAYVLDPIAFVMSGDLLRSITAGVIDFINGKTNGTGSPQYEQNLQRSLLVLGDTRAVAFFGEIGNSNSPFASTIMTSLRNNYLLNTSAAGFWAQNRCTLFDVSPNVPMFLAGDFRQGGWSAWLSLTTQPNNNPYLLYYQTQAELDSRVRGAVANRLEELGWGQGFISWCGDITSTGGGDSTDPNAIPDSVAVTSAQDCTKSDGTPGTIKTPGSMIKATLDQVLGTNLQKATLLGDAGGQITQIFSDLAGILQTIGYGATLLGAGGSGGLFGFSQSGPTAVSPLDTYRTTQGYLNITTGGIVQNVQNSGQGDTLATRINKFSTAWQSIKTRADSAQTAVNQAIAACPSTYTALLTSRVSSQIQPVLSEYATAQTTIQSAQATLAALPPSTAATLADDLINQRNIVPTAYDVGEAQALADPSTPAAADPTGSLNVISSSYVAGFVLLTKNANAMTTACLGTTTPILVI